MSGVPQAISSLPYWHGNLTTQTANQRLQNQTDGHWLIRPSSSPGHFSISYVESNAVKHTRVRFDIGSWILVDNPSQPTFASFQEIIANLPILKIPISNPAFLPAFSPVQPVQQPVQQAVQQPIQPVPQMAFSQSRPQPTSGKKTPGLPPRKLAPEPAKTPPPVSFSPETKPQSLTDELRDSDQLLMELALAPPRLRLPKLRQLPRRPRPRRLCQGCKAEMNRAWKLCISCGEPNPEFQPAILPPAAAPAPAPAPAPAASPASAPVPSPTPGTTPAPAPATPATPAPTGPTAKTEPSSPQKPSAQPEPAPLRRPLERTPSSFQRAKPSSFIQEDTWGEQTLNLDAEVEEPKSRPSFTLGATRGRSFLGDPHPISQPPFSQAAPAPAPVLSPTPRTAVPSLVSTGNDAALLAAFDQLMGEYDRLAPAPAPPTVTAAPAAPQARKPDIDLHALVTQGEYDKISALLGNPAQAKALSNARDANGHTPLHVATEQGNDALVHLLLDKGGADATVATADGNTVLHYAVRGWANPEGQAGILDRLQSEGADLEATNALHETPLHTAVMRGTTLAAEWLLRQGAKPNALCALRTQAAKAGNFDVTPLHLAIIKSSQPMLLLLIEAGADRNAPSQSLGTPLEFAQKEWRGDDKAAALKLLAEGAPTKPEQPINPTEGQYAAYAKLKAEYDAYEKERQKVLVFAKDGTLNIPPSAPTGRPSVAGVTERQHAGILIKTAKGAIGLKSRKSRWFVLKGDTLSYYKDRGEATPLGTIQLKDSTVRRAPERDKLSFDLVTSDRTYLLQADGARSLSEWLEQLGGVPSPSPKPAEAGPLDTRRQTLVSSTTGLMDEGFRDLTVWPSLINPAAVQSLHLEGNQLTDIPEAVGELVNLRELFAMGNRLISLPAQLCLCTSLEILQLSNNTIGFVSPSIAKLNHLEELNLSGNSLTALPAELGYCIGLEVLDLGLNSVAELPPTIGYLSRLIELDLSENKLRQIPDTIGRLTRLSSLNLSCNLLTELPQSIGLCTGLYRGGLFADSNAFTDPRIAEKMAVGRDHLFDYLEKRLVDSSPPRLPPLPVPGDASAAQQAAAAKAQAPSLAAAQPRTSATEPARTESLAPATPSVEQKTLLLRDWVVKSLGDLITQIAQFDETLAGMPEGAPPPELVRIAKLTREWKKTTAVMFVPGDIPPPKSEPGTTLATVTRHALEVTRAPLIVLRNLLAKEPNLDLIAKTIPNVKTLQAALAEAK